MRPRVTDGLPIGDPNTLKRRHPTPLVLIATIAVLFGAAFAFCQSASAEGALKVTDISAMLRGQDTVKTQAKLQQSDVNDGAFSALSAFAQGIAAQAPAHANTSAAPLDEPAFAALKGFAERLGTAQPESMKSMPKVAEADNALDALREFMQGGSTSAPPPAASSKSGPVAGGKQSRPLVEATYVGAKVCLTCHSTQAEAFGKTLMGRIGKTQKGKFDCENCHGPGSAHVKAGGGRGVGGIISFRPEDQARTAEENNGVCLACHERGDRTNWHGSTHETRGLMCTNCHTVMKEVSRKNQLKTAFEPETCFQCHKDRRAQMFRSSHMPLREGKIVCSDCHNPHGSNTEALLKKDSINDTCYTCHAEKRGPFLFEHAPVRENCDNCHEPHGTVNENSLKLSRPRLCFECHQFGHSPNAGISSSFTMGRSCQNCHTAVHGSNSPAGGAFQR